jgi:hypothetical protein
MIITIHQNPLFIHPYKKQEKNDECMDKDV